MQERYEVLIGGRVLALEAGKLAGLAHGAVTVRYGDTIVLATATVAKEPREGVDFLPLTVDFEERLYAAGKIPGSFLRREGRPSEHAILVARLTDRPLRPLFPKGLRNEVQIIVTALSADQENEPEILSIIGASAALTISPIPFEGPVGAVRVGYLDGQFIINPTSTQLLESRLDLAMAGTADAVVMIEAGASEVPEEVVVEAIRHGHDAIRDIIQLQERMRQDMGLPKLEFPSREIPEEVRQGVAEFLGERLEQAVYQADKAERERALDELRQEVAVHFAAQLDPKQVFSVFDDLEKAIVRRRVLGRGVRPDGRGLAEIRPISCEVGLLPRTHGSGLFTRGQTQVLTIATLGSVADEQKLDGLGTEETKRFMHHYSMPPFSTGETRPLRGPGRREIGHGALAERALAAVIPSKEEFPYTIRLASEVLSSNGSTSMASVCGSTLAMMDAGVPLKAPVAGIAMGLVTGKNGAPAILTDIQGIEDALGDMDLKVAGTTQGITALQMDIKLQGLSYEVLEKALAQAREARLFVLERMRETISASRPELSPYAPRIHRLTIPVDKIGTLIGPGGRTIRSIQEEAKVEIEVEDDGTVFVSAPDNESLQKAVGMVERLTKDVELGAVYLGKVTRLTSFGAFVEILPGKEGLVRLGEMAEYRVSRPEDVVSIGDEVMVMVTEIDPQGRINLSRRAVLEGTTPRPLPSAPPRTLPGRPVGDRRPLSPRPDARPPLRGGPPLGERRPPYPTRRPEPREGPPYGKRW